MGKTHPVGLSTTRSKFDKLYNMAKANPKAVVKPMAIVLINARGTAVVALFVSSAKCTAPSMPANIKFGLAMPVRNTTAFDFQPVLLMKVVQTYSEELKESARARQVMVITANDIREKITVCPISAGLSIAATILHPISWIQLVLRCIRML